MKPKQDFSDNPFGSSEFLKFFESYQHPVLDMKSIMETQRKNMQALSQAQQLALQACQTLGQRQGKILSQMVEDNSVLAREVLSEGTPEEKISKNAEVFKHVYERTINSMQEFSKLLGQCGQEASDIINKRVAATMSEIQDAIEKSQRKKAA